MPYNLRRWEETFQLLRKWTAVNGHSSPAQSVNNDEYPGLGTWVSRQRTAYSNEQKLRQGLLVKGSARISQERIHKLETLGFQWNRTAYAGRKHRFHAGLLQPPQQQFQQPQQQVQLPVPASLTSKVRDGLVGAAAALLQLRQAGGGGEQRQGQSQGQSQGQPQEQPQEQPQGPSQGQSQEQSQEQPQEQGVSLEGGYLSANASDPDATETEDEVIEDEEDSERSRPEGDGHVANAQKRPRDDATSVSTSTGTFASHCGSVRLAGGGSSDDGSDDSSDVKRTKRLLFPAPSSSDAPQRTKATVNHASKAAASKLGVCKQAKDKIRDDAARAERFKRMYVNFWLKRASCPLHKLNVSMSCRIGTARRTR